MIDKIFAVASTALVITGLGIALRKDAPTAKVIEATLNGFSKIQLASFGPTK